MGSPFRFTKLKVATGYFLLLVFLLVSLLLINKQMENLTISDTQQVLISDSLFILLQEKDENTIKMLRSLSEVNERLLSIDFLEEAIAEQDSILNRQRVLHKTITTSDSIITEVTRKGFFRRLGEVFVPPKDTSRQMNTVQEIITDTIIQEYNPVDSLQERIRTLNQERRENYIKSAQRANARLRTLNNMLTARIDSLIRQNEQAISSQAQHDAEYQLNTRRKATRIVGGIAVGAVFLSAIFLIIILRDITRSNRYRKELEEARKHAEALLQAREKFMLTITHDFKAPLSSIIGYTDLLSRLIEDDRQRFYLDNMKSSSTHLLRLVNDLLDFHRLDLNKEEVNRVTFDPGKLFEELYVSFEPLTSKKGLNFGHDIDPQLNGRFAGDPLRIRQIVTNLLSNAVKFTPDGSISLAAKYHTSLLTIQVKDTGKGMSGKDKERIFKEFTRLPGAQSEEGFGLGLSIVRKLVGLLEGTITVDSTEGKGSTFTVQLPLFPVHGKPDTPPETDTQPEETAAKPAMRILLIDDDKIQLTLTAAMLENQGFSSASCTRVEELIEYLRQETFDVLLTDIQMPAMNGFELLKLLRSSNIPQARSIPVLAVTARGDMDMKTLKDNGFSGCIRKPFSMRDLLQALGETDLPEKQTPAKALDFSALTRYSAGDNEAAQAILMSFLEETTKNTERLRDALQAEDVGTITSMAHKFLPLFTLIHATEITPLLIWLEARRDEPFSDEMKRKTLRVLKKIEAVLKIAGEEMKSR